MGRWHGEHPALRGPHDELGAGQRRAEILGPLIPVRPRICRRYRGRQGTLRNRSLVLYAPETLPQKVRMMTSNTSTPPVLPDDILHLIWTGSSSGLPAAIRAERARIDEALAELDRRTQAIERERNALALRASVLDALAAGKTPGRPRDASPAAPRTGSEGVARANAAVPSSRSTDGRGSSSTSPSSQMRPDQRAHRKNLILSAARKYAMANGAEFSARDLVPILHEEGIVLGVKESHVATAIANIIFHSGDPRFTLARPGVFRFDSSPKKAVATKGKT